MKVFQSPHTGSSWDEVENLKGGEATDYLVDIKG